MFTIHTEFDRDNKNKTFSKMQIPYNTGSSSFAIQKTRTRYYDTETITYLEPKIWNLLPNEIKSSMCGVSTSTSKQKF